MTTPYLGNPKYTIEVLQKYGFVFQIHTFWIVLFLLLKLQKMILYWKLVRESEP